VVRLGNGKKHSNRALELVKLLASSSLAPVEDDIHELYDRDLPYMNDRLKHRVGLTSVTENPKVQLS